MTRHVRCLVWLVLYEVVGMPNWCNNVMKVYGSKEEVERLVDYLQGRHDEHMPLDSICELRKFFDFNRVVPYPKKFKQMDFESLQCDRFHGSNLKVNPLVLGKLKAAYKRKWNTEYDGYNFGGYEWCCKNWGTKWNASHVSFDRLGSDVAGDAGVIYRFDTPWCPPFQILRKVFKKFDKLTFEVDWDEESGSHGKIIGEDGVLTVTEGGS